MDRHRNIRPASAALFGGFLGGVLALLAVNRGVEKARAEITYQPQQGFGTNFNHDVTESTLNISTAPIVTQVTTKPGVYYVISIGNFAPTLSHTYCTVAAVSPGAAALTPAVGQDLKRFTVPRALQVNPAGSWEPNLVGGVHVHVTAGRSLWCTSTTVVDQLLAVWLGNGAPTP
jgi:hypothetical protein